MRNIDNFLSYFIQKMVLIISLTVPVTSACLQLYFISQKLHSKTPPFSHLSQNYSAIVFL